MSLRTCLAAVSVCVGCMMFGCSGGQDKNPDPKGSKPTASKEKSKAPEKTRYDGKGRYVDVRDPKDTPPPVEKTTEPKKPRELSKATIDGWENSGFTAGWRGTNPAGQVVFASEPKDLPDAMPAFTARQSTNNAGVKALPAPELPFALILRNSKVTDAGLKELAGLTNLVYLDLGFTKVKGPGLADLAGLPNLTSLTLRSTDVTDAGLKPLAGLTKLTTLGLGNTKVTDQGMTELVRLKNLTSLDIGLTDVTDVGLKQVAELKHLSSLNLNFTKVTATGLKELQQALPKCVIAK